MWVVRPRLLHDDEAAGDLEGERLLAVGQQAKGRVLPEREGRGEKEGRGGGELVTREGGSRNKSHLSLER